MDSKFSENNILDYIDNGITDYENAENKEVKEICDSLCKEYFTVLEWLAE